MESQDAINYLESLEKGNFLTVNIPIYKGQIQSVTVMYIGKDKEGRYNFVDNGEFKMSREFLEKGTVTIEKEFDGDVALDIHAKIRMEQKRKKNIYIYR